MLEGSSSTTVFLLTCKSDLNQLSIWHCSYCHRALIVLRCVEMIRLKFWVSEHTRPRRRLCQILYITSARWRNCKDPQHSSDALPGWLTTKDVTNFLNQICGNVQFNNFLRLNNFKIGSLSDCSSSCARLVFPSSLFSLSPKEGLVARCY